MLLRFSSPPRARLATSLSTCPHGAAGLVCVGWRAVAVGSSLWGHPRCGLLPAPQDALASSTYSAGSMIGSPENAAERALSAGPRGARGTVASGGVCTGADASWMLCDSGGRFRLLVLGGLARGRGGRLVERAHPGGAVDQGCGDRLGARAEGGAPGSVPRRSPGRAALRVRARELWAAGACLDEPGRLELRGGALLEGYREGRRVLHRDAYVQPCARPGRATSRGWQRVEMHGPAALMVCCGAGDMRAKVVAIAMRSPRASGYFGIGEVRRQGQGWRPGRHTVRRSLVLRAQRLGRFPC